MEKVFVHAKNKHPNFNIIHFRTLSYSFLTWAFNEVLIFQKPYIRVNGNPRIEKISSHVKDSASYPQKYPF